MFAEDLSTFFDVTSGFATTATLAGQPVPVIFDAAYAGALSGLVETTGPQCIAKTADVAGAVQGNTITINAVAYTITGIQPDGTGITTLQLRG
jgi:hypothetical protein